MTCLRLFFVVFLCNLLVACSPDKKAESVSDFSTDENKPAAIEDTPDIPENNSTDTDDNCGSLKPLLGLLPQAKQIDGLPEVFRGCENTSEQTVSVLYANEGDDYSEYQFKIYVLHPESVYAKANLTLEDATEEQQAFMNKAFNVTGDMHKSQFDLCKHYHQNPMIPDGRNPLIIKVQDLDTCVMDNMDANKEIWNLYTIKNDLEFRLELQGSKAAVISTTEKAREQLAPVFDQFNLGASPQ